jgi:hypothetical protein
MAITYKVLGQSAPASTANADLITVSAGQNEIISTLVICNNTASPATARVFVRIAGAAAAVGNAIIYDASIAANSTAAFTFGITIAATDVVTVRSSVANALTFTAFGTELS